MGWSRYVGKSAETVDNVSRRGISASLEIHATRRVAAFNHHRMGCALSYSGLFTKPWIIVRSQWTLRSAEYHTPLGSLHIFSRFSANRSST